MSAELPPCPKCSSTYTYTDPSGLYVCPECAHEWRAGDAAGVTDDDDAFVVKDSVGNVLHDGDDVVVIKDLPVKGAPKPIKKGTKVKNIKLVDSDHNIDCRIEGVGAMALKSEFVKKA